MCLLWLQFVYAIGELVVLKLFGRETLDTLCVAPGWATLL